MNKLSNVGFGAWVEAQLDTSMMARHELARVVSVHKDRYLVNDGLSESFAELSGNLFYSAESAEDLPTAGDWVYADFYDEHSHAIIHGIVPRKTLLRRKAAGKAVDIQLIAANIDVAFIMQSADYNFNLRRLERYLVMVNESGIIPVILLSKSDLITRAEMAELKRQISAVAPQHTVWSLSNLNREDVDTVKASLRPEYTYCLLGSSGVGKTTLLNRILGNEKLATQSVSKIKSKGRHTTSHRELVQLENGAMLIDTPGMRELGTLSTDTGVDETFAEIAELARKCKYLDCSHTNEKACAILKALDEGTLQEQRYKSFMKMKRESAFNELSLAQKRRKDKEFAKLVKSVMKNKLR